MKLPLINKFKYPHNINENPKKIRVYFNYYKYPILKTKSGFLSSNLSFCELNKVKIFM